MRAYNVYYPTDDKNISYTLDLVKQIYEDVYICIANKAKDDSKFIKQMKNLINVLPGLSYLKN